MGLKEIIADRTTIRAWVRSHARDLELAQAEGRLATAKIDLKDNFKSGLAKADEAGLRLALEMFGEEIEAACADLRLAAVTVQQQVERKKGLGPFWSLMAIVAAFGGGAVAFFIGVLVTGGGIGAGFLAFMAVFGGILWMAFK